MKNGRRRSLERVCQTQRWVWLLLNSLLSFFVLFFTFVTNQIEEEDPNSNEEDDDDGFFVPHGYLSADEGDMSDGEIVS